MFSFIRMTRSFNILTPGIRRNNRFSSCGSLFWNKQPNPLHFICNIGTGFHGSQHASGMLQHHRYDLKYISSFEYSPESFLAPIPTMRAFPRLSTLYEAWKSLVEEQSQGSVDIVTNREVTRVQHFSRKCGGWSRSTKGTNNNQTVIDPGDEVCEAFDEIVLCTVADAGLQVLGNDAKWLERRVLGNVKVCPVHLAVLRVLINFPSLVPVGRNSDA